MKLRLILFLLACIGTLSVFSFMKENQEEGSKKIRISFSKPYDRKISDDFHLPARKVYLHVDDYDKVEIPIKVLDGQISEKLFPEMTEEFKRYVERDDADNIVFQFYYEYADTGDIYIATEKDNKLRIYKKVITQEDGLNPTFEWILTYDITEKPKLVARPDESDFTLKDK